MKFVSPAVYGAALLPAVVLAVWTTSLVTNTVFIRPDFYDGTTWPLVVVAPGILIGLALFAGIARITASFERLSRPKKLDHFRRCAPLYLVLVFVVGWAALSYSPTGSNYAFSLQLQILAVVCAGILADALVLSMKNRTNKVNNAGGET